MKTVCPVTILCGSANSARTACANSYDGTGGDHGGSIQAARPLRASTYPSPATQRGDDQAHLLAHSSTDSAFEVFTDANKVVNPANEEPGGNSALTGAQSVASCPPPIQYSTSPAQAVWIILPCMLWLWHLEVPLLAAAAAQHNTVQGHHCGMAAAEEELRQTDRMFDRMILSDFLTLGLGWGLLFSDWAFNEVEKHPKVWQWSNLCCRGSAMRGPVYQEAHARAKPQAEPWINDAVTIGGASAVLSPIIQWGHTIMYTNGKVQRLLLLWHAYACPRLGTAWG